MVEIKESSLISQFFQNHSNKKGFWDALIRLMHPDFIVWTDDDPDASFEEGIRVGLKAAKEDKPIYKYNDDGGHGSYNQFFWVGTEQEILKKLKNGWKAYNDPKRKVDLKRKHIQLEIDRLQSQLDNL